MGLLDHRMKGIARNAFRYWMQKLPAVRFTNASIRSWGQK